MPLFNGIFGSTPEEPEQQQPTQRPTTRSQSRNTPANLELPLASFNGVARGRPRTPSPRQVGHNANSAVIFAYDSTNVSQQLLHSQAQAEEAGEFDSATESSAIAASTAEMSTIEELRASAAAAVEAANAATAALIAATGLVSQQASQQQQTAQIRTRKPELPEFDAKNVEVWLKRVQSAYDRAGISLPKDKFAFLESKFAVGANPSIDEYLYGPATEESWEAFVAFLKEEYGRTVRQEAQFLLGQHSRDGRKPSQMLAHLNDKTKRVSIDDIKKEIIISSLPPNVQQMIAERVKELSAAEAAAAADKYFSQDGRPLHSHAPTIQHVGPSQAETTSPEDDYDDDGARGSDVNAIRGRRGGGRGGFRNSNNNNRAPRSFHNNNNYSGQGGHNNNSNRAEYNHRSIHNGRGGQQQTPPSASSTSFNAAASSNATKTLTLCQNHQRHGDRTITCQPGCSRWSEHTKRQQGNANAGNRM